MSNFEKRLKAIEERNSKVEADKAWEVSAARRACITALTYVVVSIYLLVVGNERPFVNAIVPATGYLLSTLAMKQAKKMWQSSKNK